MRWLKTSGITMGLALVMAAGATLSTAAETETQTARLVLAKSPYVNKEYGFSIRFPEGWQIKGSAVTGTIIKARRDDEGVPITFMSIASYPASQDLDITQLTHDRLLRDYILGGQEVEAKIRSAGPTTLDGRPAIWMEVEFVGGFSLHYFVLKDDKLFRLSGATEGDEAWFSQNRPIFEQSICSFGFIEPSEGDSGGTPGASPNSSPPPAQTLRAHTDERHGFSIRYPSDWTVKDPITEGTLFKAVKRFADGQYMMLTVNTQVLDRSDYTTSDFSIEEIAGFAREMYGADNVTVVQSSRGEVGGIPNVCLLLDIKPPMIRPKMQYCMHVIRHRSLYTIIALCDKSLYEQNSDTFKQLVDSFSFVVPDLPDQKTQSSQMHDSPEYRLIAKEPEEGMPMLAAFLRVFAVLFVTGCVVGCGKFLFAKKQKKPIQVGGAVLGLVLSVATFVYLWFVLEWAH